MRYLKPKEVLVIHARIIDQTGGSQGVRDVGLLESAVMGPQQSFGGKEVHEGVFAKAAALLERIASHHAFVDGNKRTAIAAAARFLYVNNYKLSASQEVIVNFMVQVVEEKLDHDAIATWLETHSEKIS